MGSIELNLFCKHVKKLRSSQVFILKNFGIVSSKTQFCRVSIIKRLLLPQHFSEDIGNPSVALLVSFTY